LEAVLRTGAVPEGTLTGLVTRGAVTGGVVTGGVVTRGVVTGGVVTGGAATAGVVTGGVVLTGVLTEGTVTEGTDAEGTVTDGTVTDGTLSCGTAEPVVCCGRMAAVPASGSATSTPRTAVTIPITTPGLVPMAPITTAPDQTCAFLQIPPEKAGRGRTVSGPRRRDRPLVS
jgi:hypothetical protein